ncbi:hypothetical protein [Erythrobacter sp. THAF29]|uniref:hypothetical protein n=1 Tax=Erythrobacter sp. THAF29 TaxID=2587851 RepID=UPI0012695A88|nr:hypothetical protein [Erythrobacter sp. THAF29]QFT76057.1 hypothetical protein FIU90_00745 [Erythrobacter sp. THAF29]
MTDTDPNSLQVTENPFAPDTFAAGVTSFALFNGVIAITLTNPRWNMTENRFDHVVVGRIVMPVAGAQNLALSLLDYLKRNGLDATSAVVQDQPIH